MEDKKSNNKSQPQIFESLLLIAIFLFVFWGIVFWISKPSPQWSKLTDDINYIACNEFEMAYYKQTIYLFWDTYTPVIGPTGLGVSCTEYIHYTDILKKD